MNLEEKIFTKMFMHHAVVTGKRKLAKNIFHFTLQTDVHFKNVTPGQHIRLLLFPKQKERLRDRVRTYSIWRYRTDQHKSYIDLAICAHTNGPGSRWAEHTEVGSVLFISNPLGKFTLETSAEKHLFIGDITALSHFYCFTHHLTQRESIKGIIYASDERHVYPDFDGTFDFTLKIAENSTLPSLVEYCRGLEIDKSTMIYIGGDGRLCIELNKLIKKEKGISRRQLKIKPFWMPGKTGLE